MKQATHSVYYASITTNIGTVLVATFDDQIYTILLGDTQKEPLQDLRDYTAKHLPDAKVVKAEKNNTLVYDTLATLKEFLSAPSKGVYKKLQALPLYVEGTEFQKKVWKDVKTIPVGSTRSYSEIAQHIGSPKAVRAVASACAHNRHGIVIPCHRVLRSDGGISGYRWGVERKLKIIDLEAKVVKK